MRIEYSARALSDLQRLTEFLVGSDPQSASLTNELILEAIDLLKRHPLIGRTQTGGLRELVISRGRTGYIALYRVDELSGRVLILAVKHQRESRFTGF